MLENHMVIGVEDAYEATLMTDAEADALEERITEKALDLAHEPDFEFINEAFGNTVHADFQQGITRAIHAQDAKALLETFNKAINDWAEFEARYLAKQGKLR